MKAPKHRALWGLPISVCLIFCIIAADASAQNAVSEKQPSWLDRPIALDKKPRSFDAALGELSRLLGQSILADGEPTLQSVDAGYAGTAKEVLNRLADQFDFTWKVNSRNVVLMNKRFNNPDEVPQMHLAEMQRMATDAFAALSQLQFDPNPAHNTLLRKQLYASLTMEQREALTHGTRLTLQDLSRQQGDFVEQAIMNHALADFYSVWRYLSERLSTAPAGTLYAEVSQVQAGPRTLPFFTVRFLYTTSDGRQIPAIIVSEKRF